MPRKKIGPIKLSPLRPSARQHTEGKHKKPQKRNEEASPVKASAFEAKKNFKNRLREEVETARAMTPESVSQYTVSSALGPVGHNAHDVSQHTVSSALIRRKSNDNEQSSQSTIASSLGDSQQSNSSDESPDDNAIDEFSKRFISLVNDVYFFKTHSATSSLPPSPPSWTPIISVFKPHHNKSNPIHPDFYYNIYLNIRRGNPSLLSWKDIDDKSDDEIRVLIRGKTGGKKHKKTQGKHISKMSRKTQRKTK